MGGQVKAGAWVVHITHPDPAGDHMPVQGVPRRRHAIGLARHFLYEQAGALRPDGHTVDRTILLANLYDLANDYLTAVHLAIQHFYNFYRSETRVHLGVRPV